MKIFITGGTGFIGKHLVRKLKTQGNELLLLSQQPKTELAFLEGERSIDVLEGDLGGIEKWIGGAAKFNPDKVVHLAWEAIPDYGLKTSMKNLNYGLTLICSLAEIGCKSLLCAGSCWEYGKQYGSLSEETASLPLNAFTAAKNSLRLMGQEIAKENNMQFIWTRFFYVYGPGQRENSLIPYLISNAKSGKVPELKNPSARNDFIYVGDVADALSEILEKSQQSTLYNIGSGKLTAVQDILKIILAKHGLEEQYKAVNPGPNDVFTDFYADISKIKKETGWEPRVGIEEGIRKTIDYYKNSGV